MLKMMLLSLLLLACPFALAQAEFTENTTIEDVMNDPAFGAYGRLLFPVDEGYFSGKTLKELRFVWYNNIRPEKTVEIVNTLKARVQAGEKVFYNIYTEREKAADPAKRDTGLFFFKGNPGARFAVCNAGGGFAYVGAMHDSFPHALELSGKGYNAFALIYRPGEQTACEGLARAIAFIFDHAQELEVDTSCYSVWGGSAGARMAAYMGTYGPEGFGEAGVPRPGAVIMQYTGHSEYSPYDPPTYACCGTRDGIASWRTMQRRLDVMAALGIPTEFHAYEGLPHGFGLGTGTVAEGWIDDAVSFWEGQMPAKDDAFIPNDRSIPEELEEVPASYLAPAGQEGQMVRLDYTAWVYLLYGFAEARSCMPHHATAYFINTSLINGN